MDGHLRSVQASPSRAWPSRAESDRVGPSRASGLRFAERGRGCQSRAIIHNSWRLSCLLMHLEIGLPT